MSDQLEKFFKPRSVAVIGASTDKKKIGYEILDNILKVGFRGKVYPINLKSKKILGLNSYASVADVPGVVDLAIVVIPAVFVNAALEECGKKGIKNAIVISAGFKETGKIGKKMENEMKAIAKKFDMQILGPNCLGLADSFGRLNASFANTMTEKGTLAFISQSGAIISSVLDWAKLNKVGLSKFVSLGNKAVISEVSFFDYLKNDDSVSAVFAYLEDIEDGEAFIKSAAELVKKKPLIVLKPGKSVSSQKAMQSHTGALSGNERGIELAFRESGVIRVDNMLQLFDLVKFFSRYKKLSGGRIAILTNAGGPGVIATDEIESSGLHMASLSSVTRKKLSEILPQGANINNPIDVLGDAKEERYEDVLKILAEDKKVDGVLVILTPQAGTEVEKTAKVISSFSAKFSKPIAVNFAGGLAVSKGKDIINKSLAASFEDLSEAIFAFGKAFEYESCQKRAANTLKKISVQRNENIPSFGKLDFMESLHLIRDYGVNTVQTLVAFSPEEAVAVAERVGYPLAMKIFSDSISHKTEVAGVKIGIKDRVEVEAYFNEIKSKLGSDLKGMIIQPMVSGQEIILGVKRDENFGHMIMFGLGGIYAEILKDVSFKLAPVSREDAMEMIGSIKSFRILDGYRSLPRIDIGKLADAIVNISRLVIDHPEIKELDINPIIADEKGYSAVDIRIVLDK